MSKDNILANDSGSDIENAELVTSYVYSLSEEFERDSRRYNRALTEEKEVGAK